MLTSRPAVFTIAKEEFVFGPLWAKHYKKQGILPCDIYYLNHIGHDTVPTDLPPDIRYIPIYNDFTFDHIWMVNVAKHFQRFLLQSYRVVIFCDIDEMIFADPTLYSNLPEYINKEVTKEVPIRRVEAYNLHQTLDEPPIDFCKPLIPQRKYIQPDIGWDKPSVSSIPLTWNVGFHVSDESTALRSPSGPGLYMLHLHRCDFNLAMARHKKIATSEWPKWDNTMKLSWQWKLYKEKEMRKWWKIEEENARLTTIPSSWNGVI